MHSNIATNITSCLPHSTLHQLFVAMHVTMAMSCSHKAVSDPDPHLPTGSMSCPSLNLSPRRCLMLRCPWLPAPDCQSNGTSLHSPGSCQPSLHPGSFEPCSQDLRLFCYSQLPSYMLQPRLVILPPSPPLIPLNSLQLHMETGTRLSCHEMLILFVPSNRFGQISF